MATAAVRADCLWCNELDQMCWAEQRQALTSEVYRWQKQIEFGRFDRSQTALLLKAIKEERLSAMMQLEVSTD